MAATDPIVGAVVLARQCVQTVDAITRDLPDDVGQPIRDGARQDLADAEGMAESFLSPLALAGMIATAERIRAEAKAARGGMSVYEAERKRRGDD